MDVGKSLCSPYNSFIEYHVKSATLLRKLGFGVAVSNSRVAIVKSYI